MFGLNELLGHTASNRSDGRPCINVWIGRGLKILERDVVLPKPQWRRLKANPRH